MLVIFTVIFATSPLVSAIGGNGGSGGTAPGGNGSDGTNATLNDGGGGGGGGASAAGGAGGTGAGGGVLLLGNTGVTISGTVDARGGGSSTTNGGTVKLFSCSGAPSTSGVSAGRIYSAAGSSGGNCPPSAPTLTFPVNNANGGTVFTIFQLRSSDAEGDYLQYKIDVCADSLCSSIIRTVDQTSSQTGWAGQDQQAGTAYTGNISISLSQMAIHNYQSPYLIKNTQFWWRAYAIDPGGSNTWSGASTIATFTTAPTETHIQGNVNIKGGVHFGN